MNRLPASLGLFFLLAETATAFLSTGTATTTTTITPSKTSYLRAHISEWRDLMFEDVPKELVGDVNDEPVREVCILPFPLTDVLLQGETKELCLYEERFHKLFEKATEDHAGIVAMGFIAPPNGLVQGMPLCEIENFKTMEGDTGFGNLSILATIRVVGRANLLDVQDESGIIEGYMTGWCREVSDDNTSGDYELEAYNKLADDCDALFEKIVSLQEELEEEEESGGDEIVLSEATIRRMKLEAELGLDDDDDDDDDDDEDDDDAEDEGFGLRSALQTAFDIVKASDTQGYTGVLSSSSEGGSSSATTKTKRSLQDLTALSWAYLSKDVWEDSVDESTLLNCRIRATNVDQLSDRFDLVSKMLSAHEKSLRENLENNRGR